MSSSDKGSRRHDSRESRDSYHMHNSEGRFNKESKYDDPPHSRLFIVCGKSITEEDFREHFSKYGTIEEIWVVKDRVTEEPKGRPRFGCLNLNLKNEIQGARFGITLSCSSSWHFYFIIYFRNLKFFYLSKKENKNCLSELHVNRF